MFIDHRLIAMLPGLFITKDVASVYLGISQAFARLLGWQSSEECVGKTDHDIPCDASDFAEEFVKMDKKVIESGQKMLALDIQNYASGWKLVLAERNPIKMEDGICGLFNHCMDVSDVNIFKAYLMLHQIDCRISGQSYKPTSYVLSDDHSPFDLTEKQENCLFLLIRGKSIKEIAKILLVSPRTVECHIDAIKTKLNCQYIPEIIEKAIDNDFLYYVPKNLRKSQLQKIVIAI